MSLDPFQRTVELGLRNVGIRIFEREKARTELAEHAPPQIDNGPATEPLLSLVRKIALIELSAIKDLVGIYAALQNFCCAAGRGHDGLKFIESFRCFRLAAELEAGGNTSTDAFMIVSRERQTAQESDCIHDVIHYVAVAGSYFSVSLLIYDLLQFWELIIRHHTTLEINGFSVETRRLLLGRMTTSVFQQAFLRKLPTATVSLAQTESIRVLEAEILYRLDVIAFHAEERSLQSVSRWKHDNRKLSDGVNDEATPEVKRERLSNRYILHELVHLRDSVDKWFEKMGRSEEMCVLESLKLFKVATNLANVLKHGIRGRNQHCAAIEYDAQVVAQSPESPDESKYLFGTDSLVNYEGELYLLSVMVDDLCQIWELFLRYHSPIDIRDFQTRLGRIALAKKELKDYCWSLPPELEKHAAARSEERKRLDLK